MGNLIFIIYTVFFSLKLSQNIWLRVGFSKFINCHYSFSVTCVFVHQNYEKETVVVCQSTNIKKRTITKNFQQLKPKRPQYIAMKIQFLVCDGHNNVAVFNRLMKSQHWPDNRIPTTLDKQTIKNLQRFAFCTQKYHTLTKMNDNCISISWLMLFIVVYCVIYEHVIYIRHIFKIKYISYLSIQ